MDFATVAQDLAINMPQAWVSATFSTVPQVDYDQDSDADEFDNTQI